MGNCGRGGKIILGIFPGTLNSGTPFPQASHIIPMSSRESYGSRMGMGDPLLGVPRISLDHRDLFFRDDMLWAHNPLRKVGETLGSVRVESGCAWEVKKD